MGTVRKFEFEIMGASKLKMDKYVDELGKNQNDYLRLAEKKVYRDSEGFLAIPSAALKAVLVESFGALVGVKKGKSERLMVRANLYFDQEFLRLLPERKEHDGISADLVTRKGTGNKVTRVVSYRPFVNSWKIRGSFCFSGSDTQIQFFRDAFEYGGMRCCLLSHRPEFGKFVITKIVEVKA